MLKKIIKELSTPTDRDKQDSTNVLEELTIIGIKALLYELEYEKKANYKYFSISGSEFLWEHFPQNVKKAMFSKMVSNNHAESSFAGVTAQVQCYSQIDMCNSSSVSDTARNGLLDIPTTKNQMEGHQK